MKAKKEKVKRRAEEGRTNQRIMLNRRIRFENKLDFYSILI
jgi:hypothetical protein